MRDLTRRDLAKLFATTAGSIALIEAGLITPAAAERDFTWAAAGGAWGEHIDSIFVKGGDFAAKVKLSPVSSFQLESIATAKIIAANGSPPFDVSSHGEAEVQQMREAGMVLPYDISLIPNYQDISDTAKLADIYASTNFLLYGLVWNDKEVKTKPTSFDVLLDPSYKGRIGVPAFGWYGMYWLHGVNKALGGNEDNIDPGLKFAARLMKEMDAVTVENADHGRKLFTQGEIVLCPFWNGIGSQLHRSGVPVQFESVPGTLAIGTGYVILKGTPYHDAANLFVNTTLDPKLQVEFSKWNLYPPTNRKAELPADLDYIKITDAQLANTVKLDWGKVANHKAEYLKRWNEEVMG